MLFVLCLIFTPALIAINPAGLALELARAYASTAAPVGPSFYYTFNVDGRLPEAGSMSETWSPYWWVNSGAYLILKGGAGETVQGALPASDYWRVLYSQTNPLDTGNGYYPQNIFRLVTRSSWGNNAQEMRFNIQKTNLTDTPNRDGYSGVLFFSRYQDEDTLYYAGVRQDGTAVIKKKYHGTYYTLAEAPVWPGTYDKWSNPTLIPQQKWMRMKLVTQDEPDGSVALTLYLDQTDTGAYQEVAHAVDTNGGVGGTPVISGEGYAGIRTDYEDVLFDNYRLTAL